MEMSETETTTISRMLNGDRQKAPLWKRNPYVINLRPHSIVKIVVKT